MLEASLFGANMIVVETFHSITPTTQSTTQAIGASGIAGQIITNIRLKIASATRKIVPKIRIIKRTIAPITRDNNLSKKFEI